VFLGLFNFYRKFIPGAARLVLPLTRALRSSPCGDQPLEWSAEMVAGFETARRSLSSTAVLEHPVAEAELSLVTDASATHVGAVIQQKRPEQGWRPLGFFSAQLDKAQMKYSTFYRELFAVVTAIKLYRFHGPQAAGGSTQPALGSVDRLPAAPLVVHRRVLAYPSPHCRSIQCGGRYPLWAIRHPLFAATSSPIGGAALHSFQRP
jgi:hypothetical protein